MKFISLRDDTESCTEAQNSSLMMPMGERGVKCFLSPLPGAPGAGFAAPQAGIVPPLQGLGSVNMEVTGRPPCHSERGEESDFSGGCVRPSQILRLRSE